MSSDYHHSVSHEIDALNKAAVEALKGCDVTINDLHSVPCAEHHSDATHFNTPAGREALTKAVLKSVCPALGIDYETLAMPDFNVDL